MLQVVGQGQDKAKVTRQASRRLPTNHKAGGSSSVPRLPRRRPWRCRPYPGLQRTGDVLDLNVLQVIYSPVLGEVGWRGLTSSVQLCSLCTMCAMCTLFTLF